LGDLRRYLFRSWYYFRLGYGTYATFLLGYVTTLVTVYYLAIKNVPDLLELFPHFATFAVVATVVGGPVIVLIGWAHLKRSQAYSAELDISYEANPYLYKMYPGYWSEAFTPLYLEIARFLKAISEREGLLSEEDRKRLDEIERKLEVLTQGGYVGTPRRKL